ncbi:MAG: SPOR domain-containing protein [Thiolinea sp.]
MYPLLIILVVLNVALLAVNVLGSNARIYPDVPATDAGIPSLELVENALPVAYSSTAGVSDSSCYTIGPYISERAAQLVMARIRNYGLSVQMRSLETPDTLNYLVYIPAQPTRTEAEAIVADMAKFDIKQHLIIEDGPYQNAISLGFFDDRNKAMRHAEYIRYLGYDARYTGQKASRKVFWLDYDEPFGTNTPVMAWSKETDSSAAPQLIPRACARPPS